MRHTFKELLDINRIWKNKFDGVVSFVDTGLKKEYENMKSLDYIFPVSAFVGKKEKGVNGIINNTLQQPLYKQYGWRLPSVEEVKDIFEFHDNTGKIDHFYDTNNGIVFVPTNEFDENGNRIVVKVRNGIYDSKRKYTPMLFTKEDMETLMFDMVIVC